MRSEGLWKPNKSLILIAGFLLAGAGSVLAQDAPPLNAMPGNSTGSGNAGAVTPPAAAAPSDPSAAGGGAAAPTDPNAAATTLADTSGSGGLQEKTTLDYREAPLVDVIRHLADASKINVAIAPSVSGGASGGASKVTIRLTDVTYEAALKTILELFRLGTVLENNVLRIETIDNIKREQEEKRKSIEDRMKTQLTRMMVWQLNYAKAEDAASVLARSLKSYTAIDNRFTVEADKRSNKLIIEGTQEALTRAKTLLEALDRRKQQVLIEARIVEASSEVSRTLRVNWGTRFGFDGGRGLSSGIVFPNSILGTIGGAGEVAPLGAGRGSPVPGSLGFTLGSINGLINIDGILHAYETENLANIVASPSMTVQDYEKAHFEEKLEMTVLTQPGLQQQVQGNAGGGNRVGVESKLTLDVTPLIANDNSLELDVEVNRDSPQTAITDPVQSVIKRNAKTRLAIKNGDTAVIGGLYQTSRKKGQGRIPVLGRIPILGFLFRSNDEQSTRTELMILITPRIQAAVAGGAAPGPSDMGAPPSSAAGSNFGLTPGGAGGATTTPAATNAGGNGFDDLGGGNVAGGSPAPINSAGANGKNKKNNSTKTAGNGAGGNFGLNSTNLNGKSNTASNPAGAAGGDDLGDLGSGNSGGGLNATNPAPAPAGGGNGAGLNGAGAGVNPAPAGNLDGGNLGGGDLGSGGNAAGAANGASGNPSAPPASDADLNGL